MFGIRRSRPYVEFIAPHRAVIYPKWSCVFVKKTNEYFLILEKTKKKFISNRAFNSWKYDYMLATRESISSYPLNGQLGFRSGTLVQAIGNGNIYLISDDTYRLIATPDFYTVLGYDLEKCMSISLDELEFHKKGEDIRSV
jgi:hypothetical protein